MFDLIPGQPVAAAATLTVGLIAIAFIDVRTHTIHNASILALGVASIAAGSVDQLSLTQWGTGIACGLVAFMIYLERAVADDAAGRLPIGAGDIKLIGVPVGVFGLASPLLAAAVLFLGVVFHSLFGLLGRSASRGAEENTAHGPAMAVAAMVGLAVLTHTTGEVT